MNVLLAVAAIAIVAWFAAGTFWNVRKASGFMRWIQDGLPLLGERTTVRWLGSSAVEMAIREARSPFRAATLVVFLEPRDLPWWPLSRAAGRRDTLIARGTLQRAPAAELEALDRSSWSGRDALRRRVPREWRVRNPELGGNLAIHYESDAGLALAGRLLERAGSAGLVVRRLSVRRGEPHFQLHVALPGGGTSARELFEALGALAELATR